MGEMKEVLQTLKPYDTGKLRDNLRKELEVESIIALNSNENQYGCSPKVTEALSSFQNINIYSDGGDKKIVKKIAEHVNVHPNNVLIGAGLDEMIQIVSRTFLASEDNIVQADLTFGEYAYQAKIEGAEVKKVPLQQGDHDLNGMLAAVDERTKIIWVCNPNNPTGTYIPEDDSLSFLEKVPEEVMVVVDEAYFEYVTATNYPNTVPLIEKYPNLIVLRTFSKAYGLAGLRVGYALANAAVVNQLMKIKLPYNASSLSHVAAIAALDDQRFIEKCKEKNRKGLAQYFSFCEEFALSYYPSQGNFILIEMPQRVEEVCQFLLKKGILVRSGVDLGVPSAIRVTVGTSEQNEKCIGYLREMLQ